MTVRLLIPTPLRPYADNEERIDLAGKNIQEVLTQLVTRHGKLKKHLFSEEGKLRNFVNIYLNEDDIRYINGIDSEVKEGDTITIVPSVAGGSDEVRLANPEILRYSRHLIMPEVGMEGQKKLKSSSVLLIGSGGLGSPLGIYLSAAGIGRLGLVDFDVVDFSNLHRQIIYTEKDVGRKKLEVAQERLLEVNPNVRIETHPERLTSDNALELFANYDVIVDGTDNFPTRYLVNDACVLSGKPNVYGSIFRFEGQLSVFDTARGPCYRCLYPEPPDPGLVPSCAEGGVLGVLPGVIGCMQAVEVIKLLLGKGEPLIGRLVVFDALKMQQRQFKLRKDPNCPVCGKSPTVKKLIDYEAFCGVGTASQEGSSSPDTSVEELKSRLDKKEDLVILDVREPVEYEICNLPNSTLIPLGQLPDRVNELNTSDEIVALCHMGTRSAQAVQFLSGLGFKKIRNLRGGINAWATNIDTEMPKY
ncbi:MAG: molybdopterin-synthase adenylyltransferase MoeB [Nitrososphaerales archaeon]